MSHILSDEHIAMFLADPKPITQKQLNALKNARSRRVTPRGEHEVKVKVVGESGRSYTITANGKTGSPPEKFSIILSTNWHGISINLIRCNGFHGPHTNRIEKRNGTGIAHIPPNTFHIHTATERYQLERKEAESYAEPTSEFTSFESSIDYVCDSYGLYLSDSPYGTRYPLLKAKT